jgi:hypothetical protein
VDRIEVLFGPKRDNFRYGGDTMGGKNDKSKSSPGPDSSKVSAQQQSNHEKQWQPHKMMAQVLKIK